MCIRDSLYPASDSLAKQVQRAVKSMNMPKDSNGYFIINKSREQLEQEEDLRYLFQKASASVEPLEEYETVFLRADAKLASYLMDTIEGSITFQDNYITMVKTSNGILFYTSVSYTHLNFLNCRVRDSIVNGYAQNTKKYFAGTKFFNCINCKITKKHS